MSGGTVNGSIFGGGMKVHVAIRKSLCREVLPAGFMEGVKKGM